ncbi:hypothetical protein I6L81_06020 [Providencia rettgeri]|uniref:hypothetical protein n=1 Tax=Providencia rettgeri TaxID=587 RepID=UPI001C22BEBA|nr:hypothetical protein [Providencia rettgeri]QXB92514.1 hypothetical protein I6L81_06020 [Providencia rettgeri]
MSKKMLDFIKKNFYVDKDSVNIIAQNNKMNFFRFKNKLPKYATCDFLLLIAQRPETKKEEIQIGVFALSASFTVICDNEREKNKFTEFLQADTTIQASVDLSIDLIKTNDILPDVPHSFTFTLTSSIPFINELDISDGIFSGQILSIAKTFGIAKGYIGDKLICRAI